MMNTPVNKTPATPGEAVARAPMARRSFWSGIWSAGRLILAIALTCAVLIYLVFFAAAPTTNSTKHTPPAEVVRAVGLQLIQIEHGSKLENKIQVVPVRSDQITTPVLTVSGTVAASLRPSDGKGSDYWQFNSPEVLAAFADWQKATADIAFAETQLTQVKQLAETRVTAQEKVVDRLKKGRRWHSKGTRRRTGKSDSVPDTRAKGSA